MMKNVKLTTYSSGACWACKINPKIPGWLFQTTVGTNFEVELLDPLTGNPIPNNEGIGREVYRKRSHRRKRIIRPPVQGK